MDVGATLASQSPAFTRPALELKNDTIPFSLIVYLLRKRKTCSLKKTNWGDAIGGRLSFFEGFC